MNPKDLSAMRQEYSSRRLSRSNVSPDPFEQFSAWFDEAVAAEISEPNAMLLGTSGPDCRPSGRIVLLKGFSPAGFVFFTNYESRKGRDLSANPYCFLHFFWRELERQVIISGRAERVSPEESDEYFASRPYESRIGAWASKQSDAISSRSELEERFAEFKRLYPGPDVPRPPFWGGFRVVPDRFEFWQGRPNRLHDRLEYSLKGSEWLLTRLSP
ncbi:MAG: pyridoxamine 5'-phosphate oxidase [Pyrinomonadaceae bacterium]|jgi:pyridoxamine 5'-phosphate oxidase